MFKNIRGVTGGSEMAKVRRGREKYQRTYCGHQDGVEQICLQEYAAGIVE
jgi:hypothetical protein